MYLSNQKTGTPDRPLPTCVTLLSKVCGLNAQNPANVTFAGFCCLFVVLRRKERDSNPRSLAAQRFSRPPRSTTPPSFRDKNKTDFPFRQIFRLFICTSKGRRDTARENPCGLSLFRKFNLSLPSDICNEAYNVGPAANGVCIRFADEPVRSGISHTVS